MTQHKYIKVLILFLMIALTAVLAAACADTQPEKETETPPAEQGALDVVAAMTAVREADFTNPDYYSNVTAGELAAALNAAVERQITYEEAEASGFTAGLYPYWYIDDVYLEGGPESWTSLYRNFRLECGLAENIVQVTLSEDQERDIAYFADEALYQLTRHSKDYEEIVDQAAYERLRELLVSRMEETLALMSDDPGGFSGYELTRFALAWEYEEADGGRVELYDFKFALLADDPHSVAWAGGMYLDSSLRVQGLGNSRQLAVRYRDGELVCTSFMSNDFYYTADYPEAADWARESVSSALDRAEENDD